MGISNLTDDNLMDTLTKKYNNIEAKIKTEDVFIQRQMNSTQSPETRRFLLPIWKLRSSFTDALRPIEESMANSLLSREKMLLATVAIREGRLDDPNLKYMMCETKDCYSGYQKYMIRLKQLYNRTKYIFNTISYHKVEILDEYSEVHHHDPIAIRHHYNRIVYVLEMAIVIGDAIKDAIKNAKSVIECARENLNTMIHCYQNIFNLQQIEARNQLFPWLRSSNPKVLGQEIEVEIIRPPLTPAPTAVLQYQQLSHEENEVTENLEQNTEKVEETTKKRKKHHRHQHHHERRRIHDDDSDKKKSIHSSTNYDEMSGESSSSDDDEKSAHKTQSSINSNDCESNLNHFCYNRNNNSSHYYDHHNYPAPRARSLQSTGTPRNARKFYGKPKIMTPRELSLIQYNQTRVGELSCDSRTREEEIRGNNSHNYRNYIYSSMLTNKHRFAAQNKAHQSDSHLENYEIRRQRIFMDRTESPLFSVMTVRTVPVNKMEVNPIPKSNQTSTKSKIIIKSNKPKKLSKDRKHNTSTNKNNTNNDTINGKKTKTTNTISEYEHAPTPVPTANNHNYKDQNSKVDNMSLFKTPDFPQEPKLVIFSSPDLSTTAGTSNQENPLEYPNVDNPIIRIDTNSNTFNKNNLNYNLKYTHPYTNKPPSPRIPRLKLNSSSSNNNNHHQHHHNDVTLAPLIKRKSSHYLKTIKFNPMPASRSKITPNLNPVIQNTINNLNNQIGSSSSTLNRSYPNSSNTMHSLSNANYNVTNNNNNHYYSNNGL